VCLDIADVVRDELTILEKKIEEHPDILASERFLARIDERTGHQTTAAVSWSRENTQELSRRFKLVGAVVGARIDRRPTSETCPPIRINVRVARA
jgi:hypothetical protein